MKEPQLTLILKPRREYNNNDNKEEYHPEGAAKQYEYIECI